jgi:lipopolysaccharide transport system ATP-binding protein
LLSSEPPRGDEPDRIAALSEVSLTMARGEAVAVIGANGAGKSSLLRILAGLSRPTAGTIERSARLGTLLELGAGLVDEWTGESNARSAFSLQGTSPDRLAEVERFAEIGSFFAKPVRTYSTGMRLRLAYALAIGLEPEILIADEIVAVGDEAFQRRCALELQRFLDGGGTLVLATHNLYLAEKLCQRTLWLDRGVVRESGATLDVTRAYRDATRGMRTAGARSRAAAARRGPASPTRSSEPDAGGRTAELALGVFGGDDEATPDVVCTGARWRIAVGGNGAGEHLRLDVRRIDGTLVTRLDCRSYAVLDLSPCPLLPGRYLVELRGSATEEGTSEPRLRHEFLVRGARRELGNVVLEHEWK